MVIDKLALLVPIYKQADNWELILKGISANKALPNTVYALLDRATEDEYKLITGIAESSDVNVKVINVPSPLPNTIKREYTGEPFFVGHIRNYGIDLAINDGHTEFVFIDGDCIPQSSLFISHHNTLNNTIPVLSIGRRREKQYKWKDQRELTSQFTHLDLFKKEGFLVNNPELITSCVMVWSCNIGINIRLIELLKKFNHKYYGRSEVFCSEFLGAWGGEDGFLGVQSWFVKAFITTIGDVKSGIQHIDHPRPSDKYTVDHKIFFTEQLNRLKKKTALHPLDIKFFST